MYLPKWSQKVKPTNKNRNTRSKTAHMQFPAWKPSQLSNACQSSPITSNNSLSLWVLGSYGPLRLWPTQDTLTSSPAYLQWLSASASILELVKQGDKSTRWINNLSQNHISILMFDLNSIILSGSSSISPLLKCRFNNTEVISLWRVILKIDLWLIQWPWPRH